MPKNKNFFFGTLARGPTHPFAARQTVKEGEHFIFSKQNLNFLSRRKSELKSKFFLIKTIFSHFRISETENLPHCPPRPTKDGKGRLGEFAVAIVSRSSPRTLRRD